MPADSASAWLEIPFTCPLPSGLHARPASRLAEIANTFVSELVLANLRTGVSANLKSVLSIIAADIKQGDECTLRISGPDETPAERRLRSYINQELPLTDVPLPKTTTRSGSGVLPRVLRASDVQALFGSAVSPGIGRGKVVTLGGLSLPPAAEEPLADAASERQRAQHAIQSVRSRICRKLEQRPSATEAAILRADLAMAEDVSLAAKITELIQQGMSAGQAVIEAGKHFIGVLKQAESEYIQERALDMEEICLQLLEEIYGADFRLTNVRLVEPVVIVAETLAPQQLLALDRKWLKGIVLEHAGTTSHAVILARSLGIPTLVGVKIRWEVLASGSQVVVDAYRGFVVRAGSPAVERFYARELQTLKQRQHALARFSKNPAISKDGKRLEIGANVSSPEEFAPAFEQGADGVGLFRTEALFLGRNTLPSEEEQLAAYTAAARSACGRTVIVRTLDIGGDKPLAALPLPSEPNPFLGYRGVRIYEEHPEVLRSQLRAILRASADGTLQIMVPMIATTEEVVTFKRILAEVKEELRRDKLAFADDIRMGIMIEVPSVVFALNAVCRQIDFVSIGTNDLAQYFFAADRGNDRVAEIGSVRHPAFLGLLKVIVDEIHQQSKWVGMCGDMAADIRNLPLLLGLGLDEISIPPSAIAATKKTIGQLSAKECSALVERVLACESVSEVDQLLNQSAGLECSSAPLDRQIVLLNSESETKEEVIKELVDSLYVADRTDDRQQLEDAIWAREAVYSTGLGFGFAIPHCKTDAVSADSIAVLRLKKPIDWGSIDGEPVYVVLLLALRQSIGDARHMQIFSRLARRLMEEEFRAHLVNLHEPDAVMDYLTRTLEIPS
jgi:fructose-specific PTS system IIA-like component